MGQKINDEFYTCVHGIQLPLTVGTVLNPNNYGDEFEMISNRHYIDNFTYRFHFMSSSPGRLDLNKVYNEYGYVDILEEGSLFRYNYYRRDHLGNVREVWQPSYTVGGSIYPAVTVQHTQYYPSGLPWKYNSGDNPGSQPYKYGGKEFVEMHGYDSYDFHARILYSAIGPQFMSVDPLAEDYYDVSPYAYGLNNPIRYNDPTGMSANDTITVNKDIPEVTVTANRFSPAGTRALDPISGFWGWVGYYTFGRTYESGNYSNGNLPVIRTIWNVNSDGVVTGVVPLTGTPPIPTFKGGSLFIKGFKYVDKLSFHKIIKPKILKEARKVQNYVRIVGSNPDVTIVNSKIVLQGAKNSPFAGKTLNTELNVIDFFK